MKYVLTTILLLIGCLLFASNATQATDSLLHMLNTANPTSKQKIQIYRNLADIFLDKPEYKIYLLNMYQEASKINDKRSMMEALDDIMILEINAEHKDSVAKYTKHIKRVVPKEELDYLLPYYRIRLFESLCYSENRAEAINEELGFLNLKTEDIYSNIASTYTMGYSYYMDNQCDKALPYMEKAMKLTEALPDKQKYLYQRFIIWRLCYTYSRIGRSKESIKLMGNLINLVEEKYRTDFQKQRPFYKIELYMLQFYSFMITNLAHLTKEQETYYWEKIQAIGKTLTLDFDKYNYYLCANNYYYGNHTKKDLAKSIAANDSLIKYAKVLAPQNLPDLYNVNSKLYEEAKDYQKALEFLRISHQVNDSLNTESTSKQLNELQVKYDLNALHNEKTMLEVKNKKIQVISLTILLVILISISIYFYFSWKKEKRMKMELKVLHGKAQESEKMKQEFINSICHEIRTPLNAIVGFSDLIMNEDIDLEMRQEFPAEIQKSTVLLTSLVNSMLEVANLDVSEEKLPCQLTDLRNICIQEMEQLKRNADVEYKLDISEESQCIMTNEHYLSQVIGHLLSNANKFTKKGYILLSYKTDETLKKIKICVTDTGCGIPKERQEEVFDRFYKLDTFVPGNGLGLYLCKIIIKRLIGEIKIDPEYTGGTRIIVTLPIN